MQLKEDLPEFELADEVVNRVYDNGNTDVSVFGFSICDRPIFTYKIGHINAPEDLTAQQHIETGYETLEMILKDEDGFRDAIWELQDEETMKRSFELVSVFEWQSYPSCGINTKFRRTDDDEPIVIFNLYDAARDDHVGDNLV